MIRPICFGPLATACLLGLLHWTPAAGQEWTRFRGPNGSGVGQAMTLPVRWTETEYAWKARLPGVGHSSPVLWDTRIFVTSADEKTGKRFLQCLHTADGRELWVREFGGEKAGKHADNSFASATPVVDERQVYVTWGNATEYLVIALDHSGKEVWRNNLGPYKAGHGFGASPIIVDDLVVVPNEQQGESSLVALDRATGKVRWKVPRRSKATYSTPCVYQPAGRPVELIFSNYEHGVSSIDPKTGKANWELDVFDKRHVETSIGSPIVAGDLVLGSSGWLGVRQEVVAVRPDGAGQAREAYRITRSVPLCTTPLVKDDLLFLWSDQGIVTCADVKTGAEFWRERVPGDYYASPVWAGGHLYGVSRDGDVVVLVAGKQFEQVARNRLGEGSHSTPAIAGGSMYLRTFTQLIAIGGQR